VQQNLWMTRALSTGLVITYARDIIHGGGGDLLISPQWSKGDPAKGRVSYRLDECSEELVPDLIRAGWEGWLSDPECGIAYRCKRQYKAYEEYHRQHNP
jgi:hypothetical protein